MAMKRFLLSILTLLMSICCMFGLVACKEEETQIVLVDFTDTELVIEYGDSYAIEEYVYDTDGVRYPLTVKITDADGEEVSYESELIVSKPMYTVVYSVEINGGISKKTVTITVSSKPIITLDKEERTFALGLLPYTIPEITVMDDVDGEITEFVKEIYYVNGTQEEKTDYNGTDATFMPDKIGTYYLKITATNKLGVSNSEQVMFKVRAAGEVNFIPSATTAAKYTGGEYVAFEDIPTDGIDNATGYTGNAVKSTQKNAAISYVAMDYSATEYQAMAARGDFNMVTFSYLIVSESAVVNNEGDVYQGLLSQAGVTGKSPNVITCNTWQTVTVKVKDFCKAMQTGDYDETTLLFARIWTQATSVDVYLGEIKFEKKEVKLLDVSSCLPEVSLVQKYGDSYNSTKATLVKNADLPVSGYSGDALHLNVGSQWYVYATLSYTLEEIEELTEKYESAVINILFVDDDSSRRQVEGVFWANRISSGLGTWMKEVVPLETIMFNMGRDGRAIADRPQDNKLLLCKGYNNGGLEIYLGDITLVPKAEFRETKLLDVDAAPSKTTLQLCSDEVWSGSSVLTMNNAALPVAGYDGDAIKITYKSQFYTYVTLNYTKSEIEKLKEKYESAEINFMFADDDGNRSYGAGLIKKSDVTVNTWCKKTITLDELQTYMGTGIDTEEKVENKLLLYKGWANGKLYIYLGDINLIERQEREPTLLDVQYTDAATTFTSYNAGGAQTATKATKVSNENLPVTDGYDGDALMMPVASQYYMYAALNYTKAELEAMKNDYAGAEINILFVDDDGNRAYSEGLFTKSDVTLNTWVKKTVTIDELIACMGVGPKANEDPSTDNKLLLIKGWNNGNFDIYLGNITFVPKTAE